MTNINRRLSGALVVAHSQVKKWDMVKQAPEFVQDLVLAQNAELNNAMLFGLCIDFMYLYELCRRNNLVDSDGIDADFLHRMAEIRENFLKSGDDKNLPEGIRVHTPLEAIKEMHEYVQRVYEQTQKELINAPTAEEVIDKVRKE